MCGYVADSVEDGTVPHDALNAQLFASLAHEHDHVAEYRDGVYAPSPLVKIYTSGSFIDEREFFACLNALICTIHETEVIFTG